MTEPLRPERRRPSRIVTLAWSGMALATAIILWGTLSPEAPPVGAHIPAFDKLMHVGAFAVWACLLRLAWSGPVWAIMAIGTLFGAGVEIIQPLTGRAMEPADLVADIAGCALGTWVALLLRRLWPARAARSRG